VPHLSQDRLIGPSKGVVKRQESTMFFYNPTPFWRDAFMSGDEDDEIWLFGGDDEVYARGGNDVVYGGDDHDWLQGDDGDDRLYGERGEDTLWGGDHRDQLYGGSGADYLHGGDGDDTMRGGSGRDELVGGLGRDVLFGESGSDRFIYRATAESSGAPGVSFSVTSTDLIMGFGDRAGDQDVIDLSGIDARNTSTSSGNQAFRWADSDGIVEIGELQVSTAEDFTSQNGKRVSVVWADTNGDGAGDLMIRFDRVITSLDAGDFSL
jgi:Ca2+-binding RTX toxin-like protein